MCLNVILSSTSGSPQWSPSLRLPHQNPVHTSPLPLKLIQELLFKCKNHTVQIKRSICNKFYKGNNVFRLTRFLAMIQDIKTTHFWIGMNIRKHSVWSLTLRLLMSYIYGAPSKARNANVVYIWTYVWQR